MPGLHEQFGIVPITHHAPAGGHNLLQLVRAKERVSGIAGDAVHGGSQRI